MSTIFAWNPEPDLDAMSRQELNEFLREVEQRLAFLDGQEPKNENTEAFDAWAQAHEDLEDLLDEVLDRLEA